VLCFVFALLLARQGLCGDGEFDQRGGMVHQVFEFSFQDVGLMAAERYHDGDESHM
jgi:hypothetical protein